MIDQEKETYLTLEKIATAANFPTVEAYVNHSIDLLPPDQKQKYLDLQDKVKAQGKGIDITLFTAGALGTIGILAKIGADSAFVCC